MPSTSSQTSRDVERKQNAEYLEKHVERTGDGFDASIDPESRHDPQFVKRTMRKVDRRLLPILGALYSLSLIDRTNLSNARIAGAGTDLALTVGSRYSITTLVFFVPYILLELPSNLVLRKVGAATWLSLIALLWGAVMLAMGFVNTWQQLAACRGLLGILEAGFFPACVYLISTWYIRREVQKRMAFFYLLSVLVGGFSNILAYGLSEMKGLGGLNGWRWIFIMEGAITILVAILAYFLIVDFPDKNKFLTAEQTTLVKARVDFDRGDSEPDPMTWAKVGKYILDLKLWAFALCFMGSTMPAYAYAYFLPVILSGMGYNARDSQLLTCPPFVGAVVVAFAIATLADKYNKRAPFIAFQAILAIIGLTMTGWSNKNAVRYAGAFFGIAGAQGNIPAVLAYQSNNIIGQSKRAYSSALVVGFGGIGGIFASLAYRQQDYPRYRPGIWATIACQLMILTIISMTSAWFAYRNRQVRNGTATRPIEGRPGFLYTL